MYFAVRTIWTLKLTESLGESKNDSKGRLMGAFLMAAAVNVPLGTSFVKKKTPKKVASDSPRLVDFVIGEGILFLTCLAGK